MSRMQQVQESNKCIKLICFFFSVIFIAVIFVIPATGMAAEQSGVVGPQLVDRLREHPADIQGDSMPVDLLLRAIGRQAGVNVLVDDTISDTITLDLTGLTLYDVFQVVLEAKKLRFYESNKTILVEKEANFRADQRDVVMVRLCPQFGDVARHIDELMVLKSDDGSIVASKNGNCLVVRDHRDHVERVRELLQDLDQPVPQVHIKARIVVIDKSTERQLGVDWNYTELTRAPANTLNLGTNLALDPASEIVKSFSNIVFGFVRDNWTLDVALAAMQEKNDLHVLSSPRVVVLDGEEAEIKQGKEVPYESGSRENRTTSFREAVLSLAVTPKILRNNFIRLNVKVTNDSIDEDRDNRVDSEQQPLLNRQEVKTTLFMEDGVTVVIGGILAKGTDFTNDGVPWFMDLPLIGGLFQHTSELERKYELLIFITPTIIKGEHGFLKRDTLRNIDGKIAVQELIILPDKQAGEGDGEVAEKPDLDDVDAIFDPPPLQSTGSK